MARPHIEFIQGFDEPELPGEGWLAGAFRRVLSADEGSGGWTGVCRFPAGWSGAVGGQGRPVELFVLTGGLQLAGEALAPASYAYVPTRAPAQARCGGEESLVLVMEDDESALADGSLPTVVHSHDVEFEPIGAGQGTPPGIVMKPLRKDPERGDWTYLASCAPGWYATEAERHPTVQEGFMLRGDLLNGTFGVMAPGTYFWRPSMAPHGPMFSRDGALFFFRTKGGSWEVTYDEVPGWLEMIAGYRVERPFFEPPGA